MLCCCCCCWLRGRRESRREGKAKLFGCICSCVSVASAAISVSVSVSALFHFLLFAVVVKSHTCFVKHRHIPHILTTCPAVCVFLPLQLKWAAQGEGEEEKKRESRRKRRLRREGEPTKQLRFLAVGFNYNLLPGRLVRLSTNPQNTPLPFPLALQSSCILYAACSGTHMFYCGSFIARVFRKQV